MVWADGRGNPPSDPIEGRWQDLGFKFVFCLFVIVGAGINLGALTDLSDALVFVVAIPNLVGLYLMAPIVRRELARYRPPEPLAGTECLGGLHADEKTV